MEYNSSEISDSSSNSDGGSFINCEKESTLKKIAELKKKLWNLKILQWKRKRQRENRTKNL